MTSKEFQSLTDKDRQEIADWYKTHTGRSTNRKFHTSKTQLDVIIKQFNLTPHTKAESQKLGNLEIYGVENITHSNRYKQKIASRTQLEKDLITQKRKNTNISKYGHEHVLQVPEIFEKQQQTCEERYGVRNFAQHENFSDILHERNLSKWGIEHPMKLDLYKDMYKQTCLKKYGVENYSQSREFKQTQIQAAINKIENDEFRTLMFNKDKSISFLKQHQMSIYELHKYFNISIPTVQAWLVRFSLQNLVVHNVSSVENELLSMYSNFKQHNRSILSNKREIDLYDDNLKFGIEFNGIFWHSEEIGIAHDYHFNKSQELEKKGIYLMHIYEYEWWDDYKKTILIGLLNVLTKNPCVTYVYPEQQTVKFISHHDAYNFNNINFLEKHIGGEKFIGIYKNDLLVQVISLSIVDETIYIVSNATLSNYCVVNGTRNVLDFMIQMMCPKHLFITCDYNKEYGTDYLDYGFVCCGYSGPIKQSFYWDGTPCYNINDTRKIYTIWNSGLKILYYCVDPQTRREVGLEYPSDIDEFNRIVGSAQGKNDLLKELSIIEEGR